MSLQVSACRHEFLGRNFFRVRSHSDIAVGNCFFVSAPITVHVVPLGISCGARKRAIRCSSPRKQSASVPRETPLSSNSPTVADGIHRTTQYDGIDPLRGKAGTISFHGLTHQSVEEKGLTSAPYIDEKGSFIWILGPVALASSILLPRWLIGNALNPLLANEAYEEVLTLAASELIFYAGVGVFLFLANAVQKPFLEFSPKRWTLVTGLWGYRQVSHVVSCLKVILPVLVMVIAHHWAGLPCIVALAPVLIGCSVQTAYETVVEWSSSSCWPLVPIIFEVYRLYQVSRAVSFLETLLYGMKVLDPLKGRVPPVLPEASLMAIGACLKTVSLLSAWSLLTSLMTLLPVRPLSHTRETESIS